MSFHAPASSLRQKPPRHALLFELIRQRSMAKHVNKRVLSRPPHDPGDLAAIARAAEHSLGLPPETQPPVL
ncbi:hypothetical protein [Roseovarius gaetbuli]|uniref:hypothetical protein n=1 Tax=Roseovarius gaetbuli TaxID=1356575 RepID=UPI000A26F7A2|nr:hypothetical protein [Roseovarius gaetbuli]